MPRFKDVPPIEIILLDRRDLPSAGAGETPIVCVAPAIGSRGARVRDGRAETASHARFLEVPWPRNPLEPQNPRNLEEPRNPEEPQFRSVNVTVTIITIAIGCPFNRVGA